MDNASSTNRLYTDLSWLWPMWGDHITEYARYCDFVTGRIRQYARFPAKSLLDISCGGGKNVFNLKRHFRVTGLDLSPAMINLALALNPQCEFVEGDMRKFALNSMFDAILMDDGVSYMTSRDDLAAAFARAFQHLKAGGVMLVTPDATTGSFQQNQTTCTPGVEGRGPKNIEVVFVENIYDPDPSDEKYETTIIYLIRENGRLRVETDRFSLGLFSHETWVQLLTATGFKVHEDKYVDGESEYISFACIKP